MKLLELIVNVENGTYAESYHDGLIALPPSLELPEHLLQLFRIVWKESEAEQVEKGANIVFTDWDFAVFQGEFHSGLASGETVEIPNLGLDANCADFHTHPSDPSNSFFSSKRFCAPPSIEDIESFYHKADKKVYIAFVVAHVEDIYALVYMKGLTYLGDEQRAYLSGMRLDRDGLIEDFLYRENHTTKFEFMEKMNKLSGTKGMSSKDYEKQKNASLQEMKDKASGYGKFVGELALDRCLKACRDLGIGLYRGPDQVLRRVG